MSTTKMFCNLRCNAMRASEFTSVRGQFTGEGFMPSQQARTLEADQHIGKAVVTV